jgi:hypothetical protein
MPFFCKFKTAGYSKKTPPSFTSPSGKQHQIEQAVSKQDRNGMQEPGLPAMK